MPKGTGRPYARPAQRAVKKPLNKRTGLDRLRIAGEHARQRLRAQGKSNTVNRWRSK